MILPDVNVLVYAFRQDSTHHGISQRWLNNLIQREIPFGLTSSALAAVVRITTGRGMEQPSSLEEAVEFCEALHTSPRSHHVEPGERHWDIFTALCRQTGIKGRDITDVWYAALAIEWDCELTSFDSGFRRFPGLRWKIPTA